MKTLITSALAVTLATGAFAGNSDRYNDIRFDSAVGHLSSFADSKTDQRPVQSIKAVTFSTRNAKSETPSTSYPYINPYGVGPNNDSR